jgi:hypothetical protein
MWLYQQPWNYSLTQRVNIAPGVEAVLMCRQKRFTSPLTRDQRIAAYRANPTEANFRDAFEFNDIGFIMTNTTTGRTCWFDQLGNFYGGMIPFPDDTTVRSEAQALAALPAGLPPPPAAIGQAYWNRTAREAWATPSHIAGDRCVGCHTSGPWINSPWVREAGVVPRNRRGRPYSTVQYGTYFSGFRSVSLTTGPVRNPATRALEPQACTSCHRIGATTQPGGALQLDHQFNLAVAGTAPYMPDDHGAETRADWEARFDHHVAALRCCAVNPNRIGCYRQDTAGGVETAGTLEPACAEPRPAPVAAAPAATSVIDSVVGLSGDASGTTGSNSSRGDSTAPVSSDITGRAMGPAGFDRHKK